MTKNADLDEYGYSGYGIGFDRRSSFSCPGGRFGQNILIFEADMSSSAHVDEYGYSGYGIGFDRRSSFSCPGGRFGQNILIFEADMSSSAHVHNRKKDILVLGKRSTQGLEHILTAEKIVFN